MKSKTARPSLSMGFDDVDLLVMDELDCRRDDEVSTGLCVRKTLPLSSNVPTMGTSETPSFSFSSPDAFPPD